MQKHNSHQANIFNVTQCTEQIRRRISCCLNCGNAYEMSRSFVD